MSLSFECYATNEVISIPDAIQSLEIRLLTDPCVSISSNLIQLHTLSHFKGLNVNTHNMDSLSAYETYADETHIITCSNLYCSNIFVESNLSVSSLYIENATNVYNIDYFDNTSTTFHGTLNILETLSVAQVLSVDHQNTNVLTRVSNIVTAILPNLSANRQFFLQNFLNVPFFKTFEVSTVSTKKLTFENTHPLYTQSSFNPSLTLNYFLETAPLHICDAHDYTIWSNRGFQMGSPRSNYIEISDTVTSTGTLYMYYYISTAGTVQQPQTATYEMSWTPPIIYSNPGTYSWFSPINGTITVKLQGGNGGKSGNMDGGLGGYAAVSIYVYSNVEYNLTVASKGTTTTSDRHGGGGGGGSGFKVNASNDWMVIAGGGGGAADRSSGGSGGVQWGWDGSDALDGTPGDPDCNGKGGTIYAGGENGGANSNGRLKTGWVASTPGTQYNGGNGTSENSSNIAGGSGVDVGGGKGGKGRNDNAGGGGGGGWYGGGGGTITDDSGHGTGGGGGSTYFDENCATASSETIEYSNNSGNGYIAILF